MLRAELFLPSYYIEITWRGNASIATGCQGRLFGPQALGKAQINRGDK